MAKPRASRFLHLLRHRGRYASCLSETIPDDHATVGSSCIARHRPDRTVRDCWRARPMAFSAPQTRRFCVGNIRRLCLSRERETCHRQHEDRRSDGLVVDVPLHPPTALAFTGMGCTVCRRNNQLAYHKKASVMLYVLNIAQFARRTHRLRDAAACVGRNVDASAIKAWSAPFFEQPA